MILHYDQLLQFAFPPSGPSLISGEVPLKRGQMQSESVDCRLGDRVYRMRSSALPRKNETVEQLINDYCMYDFSLPEKEARVLEAGACYIIPLQEKVLMSPEYSVLFSPKSSTGRCFVFVRVLTDNNTYYDCIKGGYSGNFYLEVLPLAFTISVRSGVSLTQFRLKDQFEDKLTTEQIRFIHQMKLRTGDGLVFSKEEKALSFDEFAISNSRLYFTLDLARSIVGFEAKQSCVTELHMDKMDYHDAEDFWLPITRPKNGQIILEPGKFYLLSTKERVKIPSNLCGSVVDYDARAGEFRTHYASWFGAGFGGETGIPVVLEVRGSDAPFRLVDGQPICGMEFERLFGTPSLLYGKERNSNYVIGVPSLSKHFKNRESVWGEMI